MAFNQFAAIAEETVWGTPVARTKFMKVHEGSSLEQTADREIATIMSGNIGADAEAQFDKGQRGEGKLVFPVSYDDVAGLTIIKHAFGLYAVTGAGPYTHTFTRKVGPPFAAGGTPTATSLSVELNYELPDTNLQARLLEGAMVKTLSLGWEAESEIKAEAEFIGERMTQIAETVSPTYPVYDTYLQKFSQAGIKFDAGGEMASVVIGFNMKLDNGFQPLVTLGSVNTRQPRRRGKGQLSGTIKMLWDGTASQAATMWTKYVANTQTGMIVTLTGPTNYSWVLTIANAKYSASRLTPEEGQLQTVEFDFLALQDPTNSMVKLVASNQTATV